MESDTSKQIWEEVDQILAAMHVADYQALRDTMRKVSTLAINVGRHLGNAASLSPEDVAALVHQKPQSEQERILRLLIGLKEALPKIGPVLVRAAEFFPKDRGGRPESFEDQEKKREVCDFIADRIDRMGDGEAKAKRLAVKEFGFSYQTIHRTWDKRTKIREQSFEEFITPFIAALKSDGANLIPELRNLSISSQHPASSLPVSGAEKHEDLSPSDCKIEYK